MWSSPIACIHIHASSDGCLPGRRFWESRDKQDASATGCVLQNGGKHPVDPQADPASSTPGLSGKNAVLERTLQQREEEIRVLRGECKLLAQQAVEVEEQKQENVGERVPRSQTPKRLGKSLTARPSCDRPLIGGPSGSSPQKGDEHV